MKSPINSPESINSPQKRQQTPCLGQSGEERSTQQLDLFTSESKRTPSIDNCGGFHHNYCPHYHSQYSPPCWRQLELFPLVKKRQKPQITSVPGASIRERDRYRVVVGGEILGDRLSIDEALQVVKRGGK